MYTENNNKSITKGKRILLLLISVVISAALCVTGAALLSSAHTVPVENETGGEVQTSTAHNNLTGSATTILRNGDTITYTYSGSYRSVTLPQGVFKLQVWGGQGGGLGNDNGGKGGYATGVLTLNSATTLYIYVGGKGTNSQNAIDGGYDSTHYAGGWNGGGSGSGRGGPGGGGATDIRMGGTALGNRIIVAGGGGGGNGSSSVTYTFNSSGMLGQGASGCSNRHRSSYSNDEGGGGGGYYGGSVVHGDDPHSSYAGSNYTGSLASASNSYNQKTGTGQAIITVQQVNSNPTTKNAHIAGQTRGTGKAINIAASTVAGDPDNNTVYFSAGNAGNYETLPGANAGLYIYNGSGYAVATKYLDWTWVNSSTLKITNIKMLPRVGVDNCTTAGHLPLYVGIRDSYGNATTHGYARLKFCLDITQAAPRFNSGVTLNAGDSDAFNDVYVGASKINSNPQNATASNIYNPAGINRNTAQIARPLRISTSAGVNTVKIKASDLLAGVNTSYDRAMIVLSSTSDSAPYISLNSIRNTNASRPFLIEELDANKGSTIYNTGTGVLASGTAFTEITLRGINTKSDYIVFPVTLYAIETNTAYGTNTYRQVVGTSAVTVEIVIKVDNTRPVLKTGATRVAEMSTMGKTVVKLNDWFTDADNSVISSSTHVIREIKVPTNEYVQLGKYGQVVCTLDGSKSYYNILPSGSLPSAADITRAKDSGELPDPAGSTTVNNKTGFESWFISNSSADTNAFVSYAISGDTITFTGLRATSSKYSENRTGYKTIKSGGNNGSSSSGIQDIGSSDIQEGIAANAGHFYVLIRVEDKNDEADKGIWLPIAIKVNNARPTDTSVERGQTGATYRPTAEGAVDSVFHFAPMGITVNRETKALGKYMVGNALPQDQNDLRPLASDADNFFNTEMLGGNTSKRMLNELLTIVPRDSSKTIEKDVQTSVANNEHGEYFTVEKELIYIPASSFGARIKESGYGTATVNGTKYVTVDGLKITLKNFTHNRYMNATVRVKDSENDYVDVYIAIKVNNTAPTTSDNIALLDYDSNGRKVSSAFAVEDGIPTITYNMPQGSTALITPYDLLTDIDMTRSGISYPAHGFTLNGLSGRFDEGSGVLGSAGVPINNLAISANDYDYSSDQYKSALAETLRALNERLTFTGTFTSVNTFAVPESKTVGKDRLYFERTNDSSNLDAYTFNPYANSGSVNAFARPQEINATYASVKFGNKVNVLGTDYFVDFAVITANERTPAGTYYEALFNIRDNTGAGSATGAGLAQIRVKVQVVNSNPSVKEVDKIHKLSAGDELPYTSVLRLYAVGTDAEPGILLDNEGDHPMFASNKAVTVVDGQGRSSINGNSYLGEYVTISLTSDAMTITALNSTQNLPYLIVKFFATDGRTSTEYSALEIRIAVLNSKPQSNNTDVGFDVENVVSGDHNLWTINSINDSDKKATRYFVSGEGAANALVSNGVTSGQIKYMFTDADRLQGTVLSPKTDATDSGKYVVAPAKDGVTVPSGSENKYSTVQSPKNAVPTIGRSMADSAAGGAISVIISFIGNSAASASETLGTTKEFVSAYDIVYFVGGDSYYASELVKDGNNDAELNRDLFFDEYGRWKVTDWAIVITPQDAFPVSTYLQLQVMVRDETKFGGDSAGIKTGYDGNGASAATIGYSYLSYLLFVKDTGIITYDYYDKFDGYYTVSDGQEFTKNYIPTVSDIGTNYEGTHKSLYYNTDTRDIVESDAKPSGYELAKSRTQGDNRYGVGENAGAIYAPGIGEEYLDGAFRYSHTIEVSSQSSRTTYVPMSYFALPASLISGMSSSGEVVYRNDARNFVAYDIPTYANFTYDNISSAITLSDGKTEWSGSTLNSNPYVQFSAFDGRITDGDADMRYFNTNLAVTTVGTDGKLIRASETSNVTYLNQSNNRNALIGNGHAMLLDGNYAFDNSNKLTGIAEHGFGITINKKNARAADSSLTLTVKVANCRYAENGDVVVAYTDATKDEYTATVTFKLEIGNAPVSLDTTTVSVDAKGYYADVLLQNGSSNSYQIDLAKQLPTEASANRKTVVYNDADVRDEAYFYIDSVKRFSEWSEGDGAYKRLTENYVNNAFKYASDNSVVQTSLKNYFGGEANIASAGASFTPNGGKFGTTTSGDDPQLIEGYSRYFSTSFINGGRSIVLRPLAKTIINPEVYNLNSQSAVKEYYAERGLVPSFENDASTKVVAAYYPLKVLIYDSCGDGFTSGTYLSLEIRVEVTDALPMFSEALDDDGTSVSYEERGKEYTLKNKTLDITLAVGGQFSLDLKNYIIDPDMYSPTSSTLMWGAEYNALLTTYNAATDKESMLDELFLLETSDYLVSPFTDVSESSLYNRFTEYDKRNDKVNNAIAMTIYQKTAWTDQSKGLPDSNIVEFHLNRRENSVSKYEFKLRFTDNVHYGAVTGNYNWNKVPTLTVSVTILNQAPVIRAAALPTSIRMRAGDSFTLMTTPYDMFFDGTDASNNSESVKAFRAGSVGSPLLAQAGGNGSHAYAAYTSTALVSDEYKLHNYDPRNSDSQHLGYGAIATDDTPWTMRLLYDGNFSGSNCFQIEQRDLMVPESGSGNQMPISMIIKALGVCTNVPFTVTVDDGEGNGRASYTIYLTVESSKPAAITSQLDNDGKGTYILANGLSFTLRTGVYDMYMYAATADSAVGENRSIRLNTGDTVTAFSKININIGTKTVNGVKIGGVAYDPDSGDNGEIGLYYSNPNVPIFSMNGIAMEHDASGNRGMYYNSRYEIAPSNDMRSFTVTCKSYDKLSDSDVLTFYVRDVGNDTFDNALLITINICTLYSPVTNKHMTSSNINQANRIIAVDEVYVKSYDRFSGKGLSDEELAQSPDLGVLSTYNFVNYSGVRPSIDQIAGKSGAYIEDVDIAANNENLSSYSLDVYALMKEGGSGYTALTLAELNNNVFDIDRENGYFHVKDAVKTDWNDKYLIASRSYDGTAEGASSKELNDFLQRYFVVSIGENGLSLNFRPVSTNYGVDILLYAQLTKVVDSERNIEPADAVVTAGTLFKVSVENSAPMANVADADSQQSDVLSFTGTVGSTHTFKVFDPQDEFGSMFTDSDNGDMITVAGSGAYNENQYQTAFDAATKLGIDWDESRGKERAISIFVNQEQNEIIVTINRRIDMTVNGKYQSAVTVPIDFVGTDRAGDTATARLCITVVNSEISVKSSALGNYQDLYTKYGYIFTADEGSRNAYTLQAFISKDRAPLTFNIRDMLEDPDYTSAVSDTDSFRLAAVSGANADKYVTETHGIMYEASETVYTEKIATVTPTFFNSDGYRFNGFTIAADSYARGYSGEAYMRVLDRCGDPSSSGANGGITIKIIVTIINSAPIVKEGKKDVVLNVIGSSSETLDTLFINIADYVTDNNTTDSPENKENNPDTYLRITGIGYGSPEQFFATKPGAPDVADIALVQNIMTVEDTTDTRYADDRYLKISPYTGYFGTQTFTITVSDGAVSGADVFGTEFIIHLSVVYDFGEVTTLKNVTGIRGIPLTVTTDMLVEKCQDTAGTEVKEDEVISGGVSQSAADDEIRYFDPAEGYEISAIRAVNSTMTQYVSIAQSADGWRITPLRETGDTLATLEVEFSVTDSVSGTSQPTKLTFNLEILKNPTPVLKDAFKTESGYVFNRFDTTGNKEIILLNQDGTANISPRQMFSDNAGDVVSFVSAKSKTPSLADVNIIADDNLALTFFARGTVEITVVVKDLTDDTATFTFLVVNTDLDEPTFWQRIMVSYESNTVVWISVIAAVLALIVILIIVLIILARRRKKNREIEEMLISEMELEEQMMRLNAAASATQYQSYGYLPPTMNVQNDPTLMLGSGGANAQRPAANSTPTLNLNVGQSSQNNGNNNNNNGNA